MNIKENVDQDLGLLYQSETWKAIKINKTIFQI